ncbi:cytochrome b/b6 domain-containing protein [Alteromonas lipotrueiana]|uniref:cytochrome b/b6 domain-containing protein n=1 Tax=Alteromonas lipotrueiana TaxID=2803815 RepID=UPI001C4958BB|nr:cytochrome b/b6 domain-containing protein [Alteromonas lipotrueiana]
MQYSLIWDIPTRLFHWLLVAGLLVQYVTAEWLDDAMQWHFYAGYFLFGLIIFRCFWGLVGPKYARFSSFVTGPVQVWRYSRQILNRHSKPYAGHNPLGGWVVVFMLVIVAAQAISGLFMSDDIFMQGPWYHVVSVDTQELMNFVHHQAFNLLLGFIALHIVAIAFYTVYKRQSLAPAMVHGKKTTVAAPISSSKWVLAITLALVSAALTYYVVAIAPGAPPQEVYY